MTARATLTLRLRGAPVAPARPEGGGARAPGAGGPLLQVRGLASHYGRIQALAGIDFDVHPGQLVAIVGANGAGKTTLLRTVSGVQPASAGDIVYAGRSILAAPPDARVRAGISQVPEGRQVFAPLSVEDNLRLGGYTRTREEIAAGLAQAWRLFPVLREKRALAAGTLSGGQQQMLAMARALMARPKLLLLDEPGMGLAPLLVAEIFRTVRRLCDEGITILLVEQNARAALAIADRGLVLASGAITLAGTGAQLLADEDVQRAYLGL